MRQLRVVSRSLSSSSASTLVHAFTANRLDYCSSLYCGLPQVRLQHLNGVLRADARMIGGVPRFDHITDYMRDVLHWFPVQQRVFYRISSIVWHCVLVLIFWSSLPYFGLLWSPISPLRIQGGLCGAACSHCHQTFSIVGPSVWNDLPSDLRSLPRDLSSSFINSSRLSSLAGSGLGAPLSSYLERALYKLIDR